MWQQTWSIIPSSSAPAELAGRLFSDASTTPTISRHLRSGPRKLETRLTSKLFSSQAGEVRPQQRSRAGRDCRIGVSKTKHDGTRSCQELSEAAHSNARPGAFLLDNRACPRRRGKPEKGGGVGGQKGGGGGGGGAPPPPSPEIN